MSFVTFSVKGRLSLCEFISDGWLILRLWRREFLSIYSNRVLLFSTAPRYVLQVAFYSLLGRLVAGDDGLGYAFVGAVCATTTLSTVLGTTDVLDIDKRGGTLYRLRLGVRSVGTIACWRALVYAVEGFVGALVAALVVGPILGLGPLATNMLPLVPILMVIVFSGTALGIFAAVVATGKRVVVVSNLLSYLIYLTSGAVVSTGQAPVIGMVGTVLPVTHGLAAMRAALAHRPFVGELGLEFVVGVAWLLIALIVLLGLSEMSRRQPIDDYA